MKVSECENYAIADDGTRLKAVEVCDASCECCEIEEFCVSEMRVTKCTKIHRKDKKNIIWQSTSEKNAFFAENCKIEINANEALKLMELIDLTKITCDEQRKTLGKIQYLIEQNIGYGS